MFKFFCLFLAVSTASAFPYGLMKHNLGGYGGYGLYGGYNPLGGYGPYSGYGLYGGYTPLSGYGPYGTYPKVPALSPSFPTPNIPIPINVPVETIPIAIPIETITIETIPIETIPIETIPIDTIPIETIPIITVDKPVEPMQDEDPRIIDEVNVDIIPINVEGNNSLTDVASNNQLDNDKATFVSPSINEGHLLNKPIVSESNSESDAPDVNVNIIPVNVEDNNISNNVLTDNQIGNDSPVVILPVNNEQVSSVDNVVEILPVDTSSVARTFPKYKTFKYRSLNYENYPKYRTFSTYNNKRYRILSGDSRTLPFVPIVFGAAEAVNPFNPLNPLSPLNFFDPVVNSAHLSQSATSNQNSEQTVNIEGDDNIVTLSNDQDIVDVLKNTFQ